LYGVRVGLPAPERIGPVAQWLEPTAHNGLVGGSNPPGPTIFNAFRVRTRFDRSRMFAFSSRISLVNRWSTWRHTSFGRGGRRFKSCHSDQHSSATKSSFLKRAVAAVSPPGQLSGQKCSRRVEISQRSRLPARSAILSVQARQVLGSETARVIRLIFSPVKWALFALKVSGKSPPRHFGFILRSRLIRSPLRRGRAGWPEFRDQARGQSAD